jgi:hypothetical protein
MDNSKLRENIIKLKDLLQKKDFNLSACTELLQDCISKNREKSVLKRLLLDNVFLIPSFWLLPLTSYKFSKYKKLLLLAIKEKELELSTKSNFILALSKFEFVQISASNIELMNAYSKFKGNWHEDFMNDSGDELEVYRQGRIASQIGNTFGALMKRYWNLLPSEPKEKTNVSVLELEKIEECFHLSTILDRLYDVLDLVLAGYCKIEIKGSTLEVKPINREDEKRLKSDGIGIMKKRGILNECYSKIDYQDVKALKVEAMSRFKEGFKAVSENKKDKYLRASVLYLESCKDFYKEKKIFYEAYFDSAASPILKLVDGKEFSVNSTLLVTSYLKKLSQSYIKAIDKAWKEGVKEYGDRLENAEPEIRATQIKLNNIRGDRVFLEKETDKLMQEGTEFKKYVDEVVRLTKESLPCKFCLLKYDIEDIVEFISFGTGVSTEEIKLILSIFTYDGNQDVNLLFTPFIRIDDKICWIPSSVAYDSFSENLIEVLIGKELMLIDDIQTDLYENSLTSLFKRSGYKVIEKPSDKIYVKNGSIVTDFDTLAYKDGFLFNFEIKVTNCRLSHLKRVGWRNDKLKKACKTQIPKQEEIIENDVAYIRKILNLSSSEEIKQVHSFALSNAYFFDQEQIGNFTKVSFDTIKILLNNAEAFMYDEPDYLRLCLRRLNDIGITISEKWCKWIRREYPINVISEEYFQIMTFVLENYTVHQKKNLEKPNNLALIIENNEIFNHLEKCFRIDYVDLKCGEITVNIPHVHYYPHLEM